MIPWALLFLPAIGPGSPATNWSPSGAAPRREARARQGWRNWGAGDPKSRTCRRCRGSEPPGRGGCAWRGTLSTRPLPATAPQLPCRCQTRLVQCVEQQRSAPAPRNAGACQGTVGPGCCGEVSRTGAVPLHRTHAAVSAGAGHEERQEEEWRLSCSAAGQHPRWRAQFPCTLPAVAPVCLAESERHCW